ncbi:MAG: urate oxidase [Candidatus Dormibacteraeota bacterium]|uniref:Uricase n=1 Tax=Candidatus Dormiibacter inghamiae TaxID=3127013 RepID=A0A934NGN4_9BACT|nr:urate oxidase [Candidatus Dormibacteraeota bacterium]MBJ7605015.1 urate oxidase [Candidatus Dormibacteraeota bacterium]
MSIILGDNRYGKAETHFVRVDRGHGGHELADLTVSVALSGDFESVHLTGDNSNVLPTDSQKNTIFAFAQEGVGEIEEFGLRLARHFAGGYAPIREARVAIEQHSWQRLSVDGTPHPHAFVRGGTEKRLATVTASEREDWVVAGLTELTVLKTTGSEFWGYLKDRYTTLPETQDRILATAVTARWRYARAEVDHAACFATARSRLLETFAQAHSLSLQQTLYDMGRAVLESLPEVAEIRLAMPNKHHFLVDLSPFALNNQDEVYYAADRPYGLIEGSLMRDGAPPPGRAW